MLEYLGKYKSTQDIKAEIKYFTGVREDLKKSILITGGMNMPVI
jgi:hypothetical protein